MTFNMEEFLENLGKWSEEGPGVTRLPFTEASRGAWEYICQTMEELGLTVKTDAYGTILGHLEGERPESVVMGSHYDSVVQGGSYDGAVGIAVGLGVAAYFTKQGKKPPVSLDILAANDEEGVTFANGFLSSKCVCGLLNEDDFQNPNTGKTLKQCLEEGWYEGSGRGKDDIRLATGLSHGAWYIEPHIEQGGILWENETTIGIVSHIVGITRLYVTVPGISNHAGTTPMSSRQDALVISSRIISRIPELALKYKGAVATVGQIECSPNVINVIASRVSFTVDIRSASDEDRRRLAKDIRELSLLECGGKAEIAQGLDVAAVPMNPEMTARMEGICREKNISYQIMPSGAGHDAQIFAGFLDTAMLFVPSRDGISHSPEEYTRAGDIELAAEILVSYLEGIAV